jgi:hypothetical protein
MTYAYRAPWGETLVRCEPGEREMPVDCMRHSNHYFCRTCEGYYGVPHDGIHTGPDKHPNRFYRDCACRMCVNKRAAAPGLA